MNGKRQIVLLALIFSCCLVSSSYAQLTKLKCGLFRGKFMVACDLGRL